MCFFIVMEIGNSNNPPFTPLDPESGIRDPDPGSGSVFFRGLDPDPDPKHCIWKRNFFFEILNIQAKTML